MKSNVDKFNQAYAQIINQSLFKKISTGLGKMVGMSGQKMIHKTLAKTLKNYGFQIDQQDFTKATKIISREVKDKQNPGKKIKKFYKIVILNDYDAENDTAEYEIQCFNAVTGKKVKIKSRNFKLKTSLTSDQIMNKVINPCIAPLVITKEKADLTLLEKLKARMKDGGNGVKKAQAKLKETNTKAQIKADKEFKAAQDAQNQKQEAEKQEAAQSGAEKQEVKNGSKRCPKCGKFIPNVSKFCPKCGTKVE